MKMNLLVDNLRKQQMQRRFLLCQVLKLPDKRIQSIEEFEDMSKLG